jgi:hypothetical protein
MRLWSIHPAYLDAQGLVALWREGLLAQKVLLGKTRGYRHHPQLLRFRAVDNPAGAIATYLRAIADEAERRSYGFDRGKIARRYFRGRIAVTDGQLRYEYDHLLRKLKARDPSRYRLQAGLKTIRSHPLFHKVRGEIAEWEVVTRKRGKQSR